MRPILLVIEYLSDVGEKRARTMICKFELRTKFKPKLYYFYEINTQQIRQIPKTRVHTKYTNSLLLIFEYAILNGCVNSPRVLTVEDFQTWLSPY